MWDSCFCTYFAFISHDLDGFAGTNYRVLRSFQSWTLPLWGYQCSPCMHPCLHAIGTCRCSVSLCRLRSGSIPNLMAKPFRINRFMGISTHDFLCEQYRAWNFDGMRQYILSHSSMKYYNIMLDKITHMKVGRTIFLKRLNCFFLVFYCYPELKLQIGRLFLWVSIPTLNVLCCMEGFFRYSPFYGFNPE